MDKIRFQLEALGLTQKEALVYLALLETGEATAYRIAERSSVKHPTAYVVLEELRKKGLVLKIPRAKRQLFVAKSPEEFIVEQEEKIRDVRRMLPELLARIADDTKARVLYFEGKKGISESLAYKLPKLANRELLVFYAKSRSGTKRAFGAYENYNSELARQKTRVRGFAPNHPSIRQFREADKVHGREIVSLPASEYSANVSVEIAECFVRIILHKDQQSIVVDNNDFAATMKDVFEMLWESKRRSR